MFQHDKTSNFYYFKHNLYYQSNFGRKKRLRANLKFSYFFYKTNNFLEMSEVVYNRQRRNLLRSFIHFVCLKFLNKWSVVKQVYLSRLIYITWK